MSDGTLHTDLPDTPETPEGPEQERPAQLAPHVEFALEALNGCEGSIGNPCALDVHCPYLVLVHDFGCKPEIRCDERKWIRLVGYRFREGLGALLNELSNAHIGQFHGKR